jgi:dTDP-4-dehydrorhamnose reductase
MPTSLLKNDEMKILVTGANGQLGKELQQLAATSPFEFIFLSREDLPIHHFELVRNTFTAYHPDFCINCAAYTAVDKAELEKDLAYQVNGEAPGVLAAVCRLHRCRLIHVSTDYVFDGNADAPYKETDVTHPQGVYGASKLEGEKQVMLGDPDAIIIRTSWVYSEFGKNFVKTMIKLMAEKPAINVVNDQIGSPTYAADLAEALLQIASAIAGGNRAVGIYHFSNEGVISWFDFAVAIKEAISSSCIVNPIPTSAFPTPAKRPAYSVLDKTKIQQTFGIRLKDWKESLANCLAKLH